MNGGGRVSARDGWRERRGRGRVGEVGQVDREFPRALKERKSVNKSPKRLLVKL